MNKYTIFIVEDDPWYSQILQYHLSLNPDYEVTLFSSGQECLSKMSLKPDLITLDFLLPDLRGDKIYKKIREVNPNVPVIMISSQEDIAVAVKLLKMGVSDYIIKDEATKDLLWNSIIRIRETQNLKKEVAYLKEELGQKYSFENTIIGKSDSIKRIYGMMGKAIKTNINISITGETGTGKELVAKAIHYNSSRNKKNFIAVNMAAIPFELIESDLFGHERGAFTGAIKQKIGKFEEANGGTLFLDEIAELNLSIQAKLLRVLQEREFVRVGGNKNIKLDVRLIIATHKDLAEEVRKGTFREDLFFRVMGLPIKLPPLRERSEDILILAKYFVDDFAKENNMGIIHFAQEAKTKLLHYYFPGNVRELKAIIDLAAVLCENNKITANDITFTTSKNKEVFMNEQKTLKQYTREIIKYYLKKNNNDVIAAAKDLDIGKSTIYKMLKNGELDSD
ncbi:DNA-binding transcriptional response regulator, NtrC family, contains REC, AAA-type ATPase, and a Fis-type DNA-binding domains [Polaribacter sp. Hel1_33_78]|jgi:DNA-binding NtrC family response regulator|uniref:sigma-54-dependent transcriptional regulator n=1 Tax=Polaribacter sp. Hel1_33_78 TaxID=1336804 RepID=UPI00087B32FE|nr:sigma-54 dependent transcriptional regulator [Polaribacter sp. Hel1_33_78]MDG1508799.1 sigma-54 dependent transcriptional regulator [Flavobacteriaceae bacterium]SDU17021.1 DNA-binding transcriptional response regulator, NtrC family, contains REC, AAA-type ATPase, and a Fis-type DNA-binding domains [Polaribacter sp. Hel1_33_78]